MPSYTLWQPVLSHEKKSMPNVIIYLSPDIFNSRPGGSHAFFEELLKDIGVNIAPTSWNVFTYRSSYHGWRDEQAPWQDKWPKNWMITITLAEILEALPPLMYEFKPTYAIPTDPDIDETMVGCIVMADFDSVENADMAIQALAHSRENEKQELGQIPPEFRIVDLGGIFTQVRIYLGMFSESFFEGGARYARRVEEICREHGGITSFEERAEEWEEIYNPEGLE